jgi:hypothetical protein
VLQGSGDVFDLSENGFGRGEVNESYGYQYSARKPAVMISMLSAFSKLVRRGLQSYNRFSLEAFLRRRPIL